MATLRERKMAGTRTAISAAALRLFAERGYRAVTMAEVAAAADVSERTLFRYFGEKDELLFGEDDVFRDTLGAALSARPAGEPPLAALLAAASTVLEGLRGRRAELRERIAVIDATPALQARERGKQASFEAVLADGLGARGTDPSTARLLGRVAVACYDEAVRGWIVSPRPSLPERFADNLRRVAEELSPR